METSSALLTLQNPTNGGIFEDRNAGDISIIPVELLVHIFSFLERNDLIKLSLVSKRWQVISREETLPQNKWLTTNRTLHKLCEKQMKLEKISWKDIQTYPKDRCPFAPWPFIVLRMRCLWVQRDMQNNKSYLHVWNLEDNTEINYPLDWLSTQVSYFNESKVLLTYDLKFKKTYDVETKMLEDLPEILPKVCFYLIAKSNFCVTLAWSQNSETIDLWDLEKNSHITEFRCDPKYHYVRQIVWQDSCIICTAVFNNKQTLFLFDISDFKTFKQIGTINLIDDESILDIQMSNSVLLALTSPRSTQTRTVHLWHISPEIKEMKRLTCFSYHYSLINNLFVQVDIFPKDRRSSIQFFSLQKMLESPSSLLGEFKADGFVSKIEILNAQTIFLRTLKNENPETYTEKFELYGLKEALPVKRKDPPTKRVQKKSKRQT